MSILIKHELILVLATTGEKLQTRVGEVTLKVPKLRKMTFDTNIIKLYR
jgi:transposase-like protein